MGNAVSLIVADAISLPDIDNEPSINAYHAEKRQLQATVRLNAMIERATTEEVAQEFYKFYATNPVLWEEALTECKRQFALSSDSSASLDAVLRGSGPLSFVPVVARSITQEILEEINAVRRDPASYSFSMELLFDALRDEGQSYVLEDGITIMPLLEGPALIQETIDFLLTAQPAQPLKLSYPLEQAAFDHTNDLGLANLTGHVGSDASTTQTRIERYCEWRGVIGESIDLGCSTARDIVLHMLLDDGVRDRGHRNNIMNPQYTVVGACAGSHPQYHHCSVVTFAEDAVAFEDMLQEDATILFGALDDIKNQAELLRKLSRSIPYEGDFKTDLVRDVARGCQVQIEFVKSERLANVIYVLPDGHTQKSFTLSWPS